MPLVATPGRRRIAMAVLLALAALGAVIRATAPNPSTLHDVGTLLLVMWLPAVGNFVGWVVRKIPRRPPPTTEFAPGSAFTPHLQAQLAPTPEAAALLASADATLRTCMVLVGRRAFTARMEQSVAAALQAPAAIAMEFLHPASALPQLAPGTRFFVLVGTTAVASASVIAQSR